MNVQQKPFRSLPVWLITGFTAAFMLVVTVALVSHGCGAGYNIELHARRVGAHALQIRAALLSSRNQSDTLRRGSLLSINEGAASSTEYFNEAMKMGLLPDITPSFFIANRVRDGASTNLTRTENIWGITLGLDSTSPKDTPFLFTRNIKFLNMPNTKTTGPARLSVADMSNLATDVSPFRGELCVIITWGGEMRILRKGDANQLNLNPGRTDAPVLLP